MTSRTILGKWLAPVGRRFGILTDRLGGRVLVHGGVTLLLGWLVLSLLVSRIHEHLVITQNERAILMVTRSVAGAVNTIMLAGDAEVAEDFIANLQNVPEMVDFRILRTDGSEAFRDNETIEIVNGRLGSQRFPLRKHAARKQGMEKDAAALRQALAQGSEIPVYGRDAATGGKRLTYIAPIPSQEPCRACHGHGETHRGVVKLTMSLAKAEAEVATARWWIFGMGTLIGVAVMLLVHLVVRRSAVTPLERMAATLEDVTQPDRFLEVEGCQEFRQVAAAFNHMTSQLSTAMHGLRQERDKLTTILLGSREGIVVTDSTGAVALINPAAERLLGKSAHRIREQGFLALFDDPDHLQMLLEDHLHELPGLVFYNARMLRVHAATIRAAGGELIGSAALIRDVTREKALEEELRALSNSDALTGLFNRRRFDTALLEEYDRAERYGLVLGLLMLDVDHFKRFNDEHGHDQGDRVLQAIAGVMRSHFRSVDYPCRYGGEEFCVIMPSTGVAGVLRSAERLRESVAKLVINGLNVTVSIGVAIFPDEGRAGADALVKAADQALYAAKKGGRNRVCHLIPETMTPQDSQEAAPS
ncbi:MAG: diguanylate cyclase [Magnetococcales bacterium]|nr:diguanylate cyclase [Magnetococcales bacterium]